MLPNQLTPESFAAYPAEARQLAVQQIALLQRLPLAFLPLLLRELIVYDWKFPAERADLARQFTYLGTLAAGETHRGQGARAHSEPERAGQCWPRPAAARAAGQSSRGGAPVACILGAAPSSNRVTILLPEGGHHRVFDWGAVRRRDLGAEAGQQLKLVHLWVSSSCWVVAGLRSASCLRSRCRARLIRDWTVPSGTPVAVAICS